MNATSFSSPSVEQAFVYRGQGYCAEESGEWGIYLGRSIQSTDPKFALDICLNLCEEYEWCLAAAADVSVVIVNITRTGTRLSFKVITPSRTKTWKIIQSPLVALGITWAVRKQGVMRAQLNACGALDQFRTSVVSTWHCYSKWTMLEMMLDRITGRCSIISSMFPFPKILS